MCGIAGGIRHRLSEEDANKVLSSLRHRGPDDNGIWAGEGIWLANTRLAIQDLSTAGAQPMWSADGHYIIVYNGELYNAASLRRRLEAEGITCYTRCDTEVLLNAYMHWGPDSLNALEGDYAFAIWNVLKKELFIARDPMGVKPLYIYDDGQKLLFASEIKALLKLPGLDYSLKPEVFRDYLLYLYSPSDATPFRYIKKLLPGHCLRLNEQGWDTKPIRYHQLRFDVDNTRSDPEWQEELDELLHVVVKSQLHSDAPVGLMLSGGLDSGLIAALAQRSGSNGQLQAFTIDADAGMCAEGFEEDIKYARQLAGQLKLPLHIVSGSIAPDATWIDRLVWELDEPQADPAACYAGTIAASARAQGIKVLLSGTGADDVFSGYRRHQAITLMKIMPFLPKGINNWLRMLQNLMPGNVPLRRAGKLLSAAGLSAERSAIHSHFWLQPDDALALMSPEARLASDPYSLYESMLSEIGSEENLLQQMLFWEQRSFLPHHNLAYMDKMGMAHSVEIRVPFADRRHYIAGGNNAAPAEAEKEHDEGYFTRGGKALFAGGNYQSQ